MQVDVLFQLKLIANNNLIVSFVKGWRLTCVTAPLWFFFCAALKQTRANAAAETRAALSRSSLLCFSSRDIFHIWVKRCCVHTAAVVVYKLLSSFWFLSQPNPLSGATTSYFSKHPWLAISCSEPLKRIQIGTSIQMDLCQIRSSLFFKSRVGLSWTCSTE